MNNSDRATQVAPESHQDARSDSLLRDLSYRLADLADIAESAEQAFAAEDLEMLLECSLRIRHARSAVARARSAVEKIPEASSSQNIELAARIAESTFRARKGDALLRTWRSRNIPDPAALLKSSTGMVAYADIILPNLWNFHQDVLVIVGSGLEDVATVLSRVGQKRILVFEPAGDCCANYRPEARVVQNFEQMAKTFVDYGPIPPSRAVARKSELSCDWESTLRDVANRVDTYLQSTHIKRNTVSTFAEIWLDQGIENLPNIARLPSVAALDGAFNGKPMLVVASGPSLAKNIQLIEQFRDRAVVVTVSHSLSALAEAGVTPDIVVTADSNLLQYHFDDVPLEQVGALISGATVNPALFEMPVRNHFTFGSSHRIDRWIYEPLGENAMLIGGGSVANNCLTLGLRMKCDPIVFVGLDLSFPGGKYYVDSKCDGNMRATLSEDGTKLNIAGVSDEMRAVIDNLGFNVTQNQTAHFLRTLDGRQVPTSRIFSEYHSWFVDAAATLGDTVELVNATEGGAYIDGFRHATLAEVLAETCADGTTFDASAILDKCARRGASIKREQQLRRRAIQMRRTASRLRRDALRGIEIIDQSSSGHEHLADLKRLEAKLIHDLRNMSMLSMPAQKNIHNALERAAAATQFEELLSASRDVFLQINAAARGIAAPLDRALRRFSRIE